MSYIELPAGMREPLPEVPPEVDIVDVSTWFTFSPDEVQRKNDEILPAWVKRAGRRPLVLRWMSQPTINWNPAQGSLKVAPGTMRKVAEIAAKHQFAGVIFDRYGRHYADQRPGIQTDPAAVAEIRDIATTYGFSGGASRPPEGFTALFNGRDLTGWEVMHTTGSGAQDQSVHTLGSGGWEIQSGSLVCTTAVPGWLKTRRQYDHFVLMLEYRMPLASSNSGVYIRTPDSGHSSKVGMEVQILEGQTTTGDRPGAIARAATASGSAPHPASASGNPPRADGQWNQLEISCQGDYVQVKLNGESVVSTSMATNAALRDRPRTGYIGLANWMGQAEGIEFRNIWIKELPATSQAATPEPPVESPAKVPADAVAYGGHWYRYYPTVLNWKEARDMCVSLGGELAVIDSAEENWFVAQHVEAAGGIEAWIGATDGDVEGAWTTPSGARLAYTNWAQAQPNNKGNAEHFALIVKSTGWKWSDQPKNSAQHRPGFVCEWPNSSAEAVDDGADDEAASGDGWLDLFNGRDLAGWTETGTQDGWAVESGVLVAAGKAKSARQAGWLMTKREFADFELQLEFSIDEQTDSGVAFRCNPSLTTGNSQAEIQIVDQADAAFIATYDRQQNSRTGNLAGLAASKTLPAVERGQWHKLKLVVKDRRAQATVDGIITADTDLDKHLRAQPIRAGVTRATGPIGLQRLLGGVRFRNIRLRDLGGAPASQPPAASDWVVLFDGKDLDQWMKTDGGAAPWRVFEDYAEIIPRSGSIRTKAEFGPDFDLALEFWLPRQNQPGQARANSGVYLIGRHEVQICDAFNNNVPNKTQTCGAIYNSIAPEVDAIQPPETWQSFAIDYRAPRWLADGTLAAEGHVAIFHNGKRIISDGKLSTHNAGALFTTPGSRGPIVLQDHGNPVRFRNIRIREHAP